MSDGALVMWTVNEQPNWQKPTNAQSCPQRKNPSQKLPMRKGAEAHVQHAKKQESKMLSQNLLSGAEDKNAYNAESKYTQN